MARWFSDPDDVPYAPRISPRAAWMAAACWAPGVELVLSVVPGGSGARPFAIARSLGVLLAAVVGVRAAWSARSRRGAMGWMAFAGVVQAVVWCATVAGERLPTPTMTYLDAMAMAVMVVAPILAAWMSLLGLIAHPTLRRCSHQRADLALVATALWVALPAVLGAIPYLLAPSGFRGMPLKDSLDNVLLGLVPLGLALLVLLRVMDRRRWLGFVADGRIHGWRRVEPTGHEPADLPILVGSPGPGSAVLARVVDGGAPFRSREADAIAWIGAPARRSGRSSDAVEAPER